MAQDAHYQYQSYNWENDAQWAEYKAKLEIPSNNPNILILKQQKWFKNNVNADYDPSFRPSTSKAEPSQEQRSTSDPKPEATAEAPETDENVPKPRFPLHRFFLLMMNLLALVHAVFALINLFTPFFLGEMHFTFVFFHSGLSYLVLLLQTVGLPKFTQVYAAALVNSENLQYIMFCMLFGITQVRTIAMFPILVYCAINTGILLPRCLLSLSLPLGPVAKISSLLKENKARMLLLAANIEIATFVSLALDLLSGNFGVALPALACWNFLTTRYRQSSWTKMSISALEATVDGYLLSPRCPSPISAGYVKAKSFVAYLATPRRSTKPQASS